MENQTAQWMIRINNQGNPEQHLVTLNGVYIPCTKVEILNDINSTVPEVRLTFAMDGKVNNFNIVTDTTEYEDTTIVATGKENNK